MSYFSSTLGSTTSNPPRQIFGPIAQTAIVPGTAQTLTTQGSTATNVPSGAGGGGSLWYYASTNLTTDLVAAGFFSDGGALGMRAGDMVMGVQLSGSAGSSLVTFYGAVTQITTAGAASLSTGSLVTSTFG